VCIWRRKERSGTPVIKEKAINLCFSMCLSAYDVPVLFLATFYFRVVIFAPRLLEKETDAGI
jgi:hypothetical protein